MKASAPLPPSPLPPIPHFLCSEVEYMYTSFNFINNLPQLTVSEVINFRVTAHCPCTMGHSSSEPQMSADTVGLLVRDRVIRVVLVQCTPLVVFHYSDYSHGNLGYRADLTIEVIWRAELNLSLISILRILQRKTFWISFSKRQ